MKIKTVFKGLTITSAISFSVCYADTNIPPLPEPSKSAIPRAWAHSYGYADLQAPQGDPSVQQLIDTYQIKDRFYRWGIAYDEGRLEVIEAMFTENAEYIVFNASLGEKEGVVANWNGRKEIVTKVPKIMERQADQRRHFMSNVVIDKLDKDSATALAYGNVVLPEKNLMVGATVIYSAELKKVDGIWLFDRMVIGMDGYAK